MSDTIILTLRAPLSAGADLSAVAPDRLALLGPAELAAVPVAAGGRAVPLAELFTIAGGRADRIVIQGDLVGAEGVGSGMASGALVVEGHGGDLAGRAMRGGRLEIMGNAGVGVGVGMAGGVIDVRGSAGARAGGADPGEKRGMAGGELIVRGGVGDEVGAGMRRGLVAVGGSAGARAGLGTLAGTIVVFGACGAAAGQWSRRGSIVALGGVAPGITYRLACTCQLTYLRLLLRRLRDQYALPVEAAHIDGVYRRYSGDLAEVGRGEILAWMAP